MFLTRPHTGLGSPFFCACIFSPLTLSSAAIEQTATPPFLVAPTSPKALALHSPCTCERKPMHPGSPWLLVGIGVLSFALAFIGAAVGLILGHLRLPLLIAYLGSPTGGAMMNLLISGTGALSGSASHVRAGRVSWSGIA